MRQPPDPSFKKRVKTILSVGFEFPLSRAEHLRCDRVKVRGLFERSEFPRAPVVSETHRAARSAAGHGRLLLVTFLPRGRKVTTKKTFDQQNLNGSINKGKGMKA